MNLELLRTFDASYPEHDDGVVDSGSEALNPVQQTGYNARCWL